MFTPEEIKTINKKIAFFMGYIYYEPLVMIDFSDCGGIYDNCEVFSKVPILVNKYEDSEQIYFSDVPNPDYKNTTKPPTEGWNRDRKTIPWDSANFGNYLLDLDYNHNWNSLMGVVEQIENLSPIGFRFTISTTFVRIHTCKDYPKHEWDEYNCTVFEGKLNCTYHAVSEFIYWYNEQNKK